MHGRMLPRGLKKAVDLLQGDPGRAWKIDDIALLSGMPRRTLEKHFRRFVGCSPLSYLHRERFDQARRKLLRAPPGVSVTQIASDCGFNHVGRFAVTYRSRFGESPSDTLSWARIPAATKPSWFRSPVFWDRPTLAILPFALTGPFAACMDEIGDEIATALCRTGWIRVVPPPAGRYHLHGSVRDDGSGSLRIRIMVIDRSTNRYIWAESVEFSAGHGRDAGYQDWLSSLAVSALRSVVRDAEIDRAAGKDPTQLTAWELSMRALPIVMAADPVAHRIAVELLDKAMELAPRDPIPMALRAWCHGLRGGHHFTSYQQGERDNALRLASEASLRSVNDPLANTMLSAAYMLAHDLSAAEVHARRALAVDSGSAWGWGRLAWVHAYLGDTTKAIEYCQIAHVLAPEDPLGFVWSIGIAAANFELGRYDRAILWYQRAIAGQPKATWINRFLAPALLLADKRQDARQSMSTLRNSFPALTVEQVRTGLPHTNALLDRVADALASLGVPLA
jgi:AraC-like DNA-binding protein/tetratricopeptide (TPR) repeat protein